LEAVFFDSGAYGAIFNVRDEYHSRAQATFDDLDESGLAFFTSNLVLAETHALLLARGLDISRAIEHIQGIRLDPRTDVLRVSAEHEDQAVRLIQRYGGKRFSLTDACSFVLIDELEIRYAFAFDIHFRQYSEGRFLVVP
jgi:predicted nucleic acid-binding protein